MRHSMKLNKMKKSSLLSGHGKTVREIADALDDARTILIATHEHPDGDALGSSLALLHMLEAKGKRVTAYIPDPAPDFFGFLPKFEVFTTEKPDTTQFDLIVILDSTQLYRTHLEDEVRAHPKTITIDHHHDNKKEADINLVLPEAAATDQILFDLFATLDVPINQDIATCLLVGIFTDTGSFMHNSVTPDILQIASFLMKKGARLSHIAHETYQKKDLPGLRIWGRALSRIITSEKTGASVSIVTQEDLRECDANLDDLSGVVNMINALPQTKYAMLLVEYEDGKIKGSLRSEPDEGVDVSKIAKRLGGGGHKLAAGFEVKGHFVEENGQWRIK